MMQKQPLNLTLWLFLLLLGGTLRAQGPVLDAYVAEALESNLDLRSQRLDYTRALADQKEARGFFMPTVGLNANYTVAGGGRAIAFPVGDLFNPVHSALNQLTGDQRFPTDLENFEENFLPNNFQETKLQLVQPLFNADIINQQAISARLSEAAQLGVEAYEREIILQVRQAYYQLLQAEEVLNVIAENQVVLEEIRRVNQSLVENEKATLDAVYQAEFELSKIDKERALALQKRDMARAFFNFLLNRPREAPVRIDTSLASITFAPPLVEENREVTRPELEQMEKLLAVRANQERLYKQRYLPQLNLAAEGGFQGFGYDFANQEYWLANVGLNWNIFEGFRRQAKVQQAKIDRKKMEIQQQALQRQIDLQIQEAELALEAARLGLEASQAGSRSAGLAFRLIGRKYTNGQASLLELLQARTNYSLAQISQTVDHYTWLSSLAQLQWARGF